MATNVDYVSLRSKLVERRGERTGWTRPNFSSHPYSVVAVVSLLLAASSLRFPSTPTYDPWSWVVWGRELIHLNLVTTGGPTWKPLPVVFTVLFAPFGSAAPDLWLVVARAGGIFAVALSFALAFRLTSRLRPTEIAGGLAIERILSRAAPVFAGVVAAAGLVAMSLFVNDIALGDSEGMLVAFVLLAVMRHQDGHPMQAFVCGFGASLDRPEVWPFVLVYAAWLWRGNRVGARRIVAVLGLILPLWFIPELIGSGTLLRGVKHAVNDPGSAATMRCPFCTELTKHALPLLINPFKVGAAVVLIAGLLPLTRTLCRTDGIMPALSRCVAAPTGPPLALGLLGLVFVLEEAVLTQFGFSGNDRYLLLAGAILVVAGAVGWSIAFSAIARLIARQLDARLAVGAALLVAVVAIVALAPRSHSKVISVSPTLHQLRYQAELREDLAAAVRKAGGAAQVAACGPVETNPSDTPLAAWVLHDKLVRTEAIAGDVLIPMRSVPGAQLYPPVPTSGYFHAIAHSGIVTIYSDCM
jgi:hypothetical protein